MLASQIHGQVTVQTNTGSNQTARCRFFLGKRGKKCPINKMRKAIQYLRKSTNPPVHEQKMANDHKPLVYAQCLRENRLRGLLQAQDWVYFKRKSQRWWRWWWMWAHVSACVSVLVTPSKLCTAPQDCPARILPAERPASEQLLPFWITEDQFRKGQITYKTQHLTSIT